jgi:hypothetical protein
LLCHLAPRRPASLSPARPPFPFPVRQCPLGCGAKFSSTAMPAHIKVCEFRLVTDCPCGVRFRHAEIAKHQSKCVAYQSTARKRAEVALSEVRREARNLRAQIEGAAGGESARAIGGALGGAAGATMSQAAGTSHAKTPDPHPRLSHLPSPPCPPVTINPASCAQAL